MNKEERFEKVVKYKEEVDFYISTLVLNLSAWFYLILAFFYSPTEITQDYELAIAGIILVTFIFMIIMFFWSIVKIKECRETYWRKIKHDKQ